MCRGDLPSVKVNGHIILSIVRTSDAASPVIYRGTQAEACINIKHKMCWNVYSLRSWRDFARECFCFGSEAVNESGEAVRGLVKSRVEFPPAQIRGFF